MLVSNQTLRSNNMNYIHLTIEERACISKFKEMGLSLRKMAKLLNRNVSTISREIKRNSYKTSVNYSVTRYSPTVAQKKYNKRRIDCHRPIKATYTTIEYIKNKIELHWSPDQIINRKDDLGNYKQWCCQKCIKK